MDLVSRKFNFVNFLKVDEVKIGLKLNPKSNYG